MRGGESGHDQPQVDEFGPDGYPRVPTGMNASVDPQQCTVGSDGGFGGGRKREQLPAGVWRDACGMLRTATGEVYTAASAQPAPAVMPELSLNHKLAIEHSERLFPIRPMRPPADD